MKPQDRTELLGLLGELCEGELSGRSLDQLQELLSGDAECRRIYLEYIDTHTYLMTRHLPIGPAAIPPMSAPVTSGSSWKDLVRYAGVAMAAAVATFFVVSLAEPTPPQPLPAVSAKPFEYVATLSQAFNCLWDGSLETFRVGARLLPGELKLDSGVAELQFDTGSQLILEGPTILKIESASAATLLLGKAVFKATVTGTPFTLRTRESRILDYGTEYAVRVDSNSEEVHVFDGEVERTSAGRSEVLKAGSARHYDTGLAGRETPLAERGFVRSVEDSLAQAGQVRGLMAHDGFDYPREALTNGRAEGGNGWTGPWKVAFSRPVPPVPASTLFTTPGLTMPGASVPGVGGAIDFAGFTKVFRRINTPVRLDEDGVYYLSYLFRRAGPSDALPNAVAILLWETEDQKVQGNDGRTRLNIGVAGPSHELFTQVLGFGARTPVPLAYGETYLLVSKIVASSRYPDQVFVRVYGPGEPVGAGEPSSWTVVGQPFESNLIYEWMQIHVNSSARQTLDEIRLGTTWQSVTAAWGGRPK